MFEERTYRDNIKSNNLFREVVIKEETDLLIITSSKFLNHKKIDDIRKELLDYIKLNNEFKTTLKSLELKTSSIMINHMIEASKKAGVGPMATVAGAISYYLGKSLDDKEIMIENGGDIYLKSQEDKIISIYAGESKFSNKVGIKIKALSTPIGICTSAKKVGHSLSFGNTDAVIVLSKDTLLADATATSIGNIVKTKEDIEKGLEFGKSIDGILGVVIIIDEELGAFGEIELVNVNG